MVESLGRRLGSDSVALDTYLLCCPVFVENASHYDGSRQPEANVLGNGRVSTVSPMCVYMCWYVPDPFIGTVLSAVCT